MLKVRRKVYETKKNILFLVDKNEVSGSVFDLIACFYYGLQYKMYMCSKLNGIFVDIAAEMCQRMKKYDSI
jgi:hypothetical protein